jgi:hypothetical protein
MPVPTRRPALPAMHPAHPLPRIAGRRRRERSPHRLWLRGNSNGGMRLASESAKLGRGFFAGQPRSRWTPSPEALRAAKLERGHEPHITILDRARNPRSPGLRQSRRTDSAGLRRFTRRELMGEIHKLVSRENVPLFSETSGTEVTGVPCGGKIISSPTGCRAQGSLADKERTGQYPRE